MCEIHVMMSTKTMHLSIITIKPPKILVTMGVKCVVLVTKTICYMNGYTYVMMLIVNKMWRKSLK
jgi:hypothetical protein